MTKLQGQVHLLALKKNNGPSRDLMLKLEQQSWTEKSSSLFLSSDVQTKGYGGVFELADHFNCLTFPLKCK